MSDLLQKTVIPNPHHVGAPARMADGRLFTDYRANGSLLPPLPKTLWSEYDRRNAMLSTGSARIAGDRSTTVLRAGQSACVDTMVPEQNKRVCMWNGCETKEAHPVGLGTGRLYDTHFRANVSVDPDVLASSTGPELFGTFSPLQQNYIGTSLTPSLSLSPSPSLSLTKPPPNRYSFPKQ
jgi:hypothetical protein